VNIQSKIVALLADIADVEPTRLSGSTNLRNDLDIDSTEMVSVTVAIEQAFKLSLDSDEVQTFRTVDDICNCVSVRLSPT
jgi:acyl carrier protein